MATPKKPSVLRSAGKPPAKTIRRVALYRRASTDEENQPYTLDNQLAKLTAYVDSQDDMDVVADYEERRSAKDIEGRPELMRLLEDAANGKFDVVVVHKVDRWSRRLADLLATTEFLSQHDVSFKSATEPIETSTPMGKMLLQILGSFAEFERGVIVQRITQGIETKVASGIPNGNIPFGLRKDADGVIEADPDTFPVVERIFREYTTKNIGVKTLAEGLRDSGLPAPGAAPWSGDSVKRLLSNRHVHRRTPAPGWMDTRTTRTAHQRRNVREGCDHRGETGNQVRGP